MISKSVKKKNNNMGRPLKYDGGWESVKAAYMKRYAQDKLIVKYYCPVCNSEMMYKTSVNRHLKQSVKCQRIEMQKELEELRNKPQNNRYYICYLFCLSIEISKIK